MKTLATAIAALALCLAGGAAADDGYIGEAVKDLPLFDAHIHDKY